MKEKIELWDILEKDEKKTGRTLVRGKDLLVEGEYHLVVHVWIKCDNEFLIQKRPLHLEWMPGYWAITGGSATSGESAIQAAMREVDEEVGLKFRESELDFLFKEIRNHDITYIYLAQVKEKLESYTFDPIEVEAVKWVNVNELKKMIELDQFVDYGEHYFKHIY